MSWLLHDHLVVRTAGFPYEALEEVRLPDTAAGVDAVLAAERAAEAHREHLLREAFPEAVRAAREAEPAAGRLLSKQRAAVGRRVPAPRAESAPGAELAAALVEWNRLLAEAAELATRASAAHEAELARCSARLKARAGDPLLRDAVLLLSPAFHEGLRKYAASPSGQNRENRQIERRLVTYLQRLAAKNETNSHFGPVNYGTLNPDLPAAARVERDPSAVTRTVFASARLAEAISDGVRADPRMRGHLRPRPSLTHRFAGDRAVSQITGAATALDPVDARLITLSATGLTVRELARELSRETTQETRPPEPEPERTRLTQVETEPTPVTEPETERTRLPQAESDRAQLAQTEAERTPATEEAGRTSGGAARGVLEDVVGRVEALVRRRLLTYAPLAAPDTARPLDAVIAWLDAVADQDPGKDGEEAVREWRATAAELASLVEACGAESRAEGVAAARELEERYEALTGEAARRGAGRMYVDRTLVFEECRGDLTRFELGGPVTRRVGDGLVPVLELWRTAALLRHHDQQVRARRVLDTVAPQGEAPLLAYLRAATAGHGANRHGDATRANRHGDGSGTDRQDDATRGAGRDELTYGDRHGGLTPAEQRDDLTRAGGDAAPGGAGTALARFEGLVRGLLEGREGESHVELRAEEIIALAARAREMLADVPVPGADLPAFTSVDLLIAARDERALAEGDFRIVVGEGHAPALLSVFPTDHFRREEGRPDRIAALMEKVFADAGVRVAQVLIGRGTKIFPYRVADTLVELRPHLPAAGGAVPASALRVRRDGAGVALCDEDGPLLLHPQLKRAPGFDPLAAFTLPAVEDHPFTLPGHTPRLTVGGVVYQRERWQAPGLPWDADLAGWSLVRAAREWRARAGMPEQVYYRTPEEPKPLLLDFSSRHLIEVFHRHVARTAGPVTVTEMLPSPEGVWLPAPDGRHTFELRAFAIHPGGDATAPAWRLHRGSPA
ncbi:hypothetical protein Ssi03_69740 [Sphaerisporangium siamense]|uniref:Lantibiotic dehydratase N-terminal domain-containing protein n=1 Tax=Sphaerisporangium siamense TaxID=795645 RepID=A0A7W7DB74_9ACTN|nr:lantibiotic dehydratase [Sphaerisporangium siamense]MBB4702381.1 hypothetical protein [Sphaerisporangium siamense]GII88984.1 hypothetical protein Ssi03_69740 [Sphaerisporangium siamense]